MSGNLTVSPGARKEGRALGAGSLLYLPSRLEEAFSETHIHDPAWVASVEAADSPIRPSVENRQPQHVVGKNKDARSWRPPAEVK